MVRELEGDRAAAVAAWTRSGQGEALLWLALAAIDRHDFAAASGFLQEFVRQQPDHPDARLAYAIAAKRAGELGLARATHAQLRELAPDDLRVSWEIVLAAEREFPEALNDYRRALNDFIAAHDRSVSRVCPKRGAARPDPACVREVEALERARDEAVDRLEALDAFVWIEDYKRRDSCTLGECAASLAAREQEHEQQRREQLLELERQALEAEANPPLAPARE